MKKLTSTESKAAVSKKAEETKATPLAPIFFSMLQQRYEHEEKNLSNVLSGKAPASETVLPEFK